ncbi:TBC1 domain family member 14 isoform X1 [Microcaecilia unicolor]|uniref:TBC1 domain family member 14 isoform X1 n=2 Tax=Microcaecilia unicolor TaxID=1415580 RepID=A0A6P7X3J1_9AMPH|nr:TBC1 domain family member 14 isoform X1 [Microcaecilia unicolor]
MAQHDRDTCPGSSCPDRQHAVTSWTKMNEGNTSNCIKKSNMVQPANLESNIPTLQDWDLNFPQPLSLPDYGPGLCFSFPDQHSLKSADSGIPTLEIGNPETVHCNILNLKASVSGPGVGEDRAFQSASALPSCVPSLPLNTELEIVRKSSTFPRTGYDTVKLYSPSSTAVSRSDDVSVCSISSLSTELSTTLSLSNEDIVDFMVTSSSSAIVTLENDETPFSDVTLNSSRETCDQSQQKPEQAEVESKSRIFSGPFSSFLNRNLFTKKKSCTIEKPNELGWKLFGKVPLRETFPKDPKIIQKEYEAKTGRAHRSPSPKQNVRKNLDFEPLSTTGLILEDRPANLPAKSAEETQKHRQEYEEMVAQVKKRELKEAQRRKKQLEERCKLEESIGNASIIWNNEILPNWEVMCCSRRVRELCWQGIPPSVRGKVWSLAIGNELNITHELYDICLARAKDRWRSLSTGSTDTENEDSGLSAADREASLELIKLDISRTFPNLCIFQEGGPYHDMLHSILGAYTCYRPDVGYVQGMSFIAAVLILNLDTADAFIAFSNLLNKPCQMAFFRVDQGLMLTYYAAFEVFFEENLPRLFAHFKKNNVTPDIYLIDWIFTMYSKPLPLDLACRIWDVFCRDSEEFLFRTALGILRLFEDILTKMDFIHIGQFLKKLPEDLSSEDVFTSIAAIQMQSRNKKWAQVLAALQKDSREMEKGSPSLKR